MPDILRGLDCFVLPSLAEGISNTILEAMATGLPVIATNVGGNGELVDAGRTGELVPAGDPHALAQPMLAYARDPAKRRGPPDATDGRGSSANSAWRRCSAAIGDSTTGCSARTRRSAVRVKEA